MAVPTKVLHMPIVLSSEEEMPKSEILTLPSLVSIRFAGFMSRCT